MPPTLDIGLKIRRAALACLAFVLLCPAWGAAESEVETYWVGVRPGGRPYLFVDSVDDRTRLRGLVVDLLALQEKILGCKFKYLICENMVERRELLLRKRIDIIMLDSPSLTDNPEFHHIPLGINLERRLYVHESCNNVTCTEDFANQRIVLIAGDNYWPYIKRANQESIWVVNNPEEALKMLDKGQVDVFLAPSQRNADSIIAQLGMQHVVRVGIVLEEIPLCITLRGGDLALREKITRALEVLRARGVIKHIEEKWLGAHIEPSHWKTYFLWILGGIAAAMLLSLVVLGINHQLKLKVRAITQDLRSSEEKYRELIESSPEMIMVLDRDGLIRHANVVATQILSPDGASLENRPLAAWTAKEEQEKLKAFLAGVFEGKKGETELHFHDAKGGVREVDMAASPIVGQHEGFLVCCFARDVTQRNGLERELIQAERLATIGKIAAGVAHEINNPIGIVRANVELLLARGLYTPETKEFLESIHRNSIRAGNITHDLLTAARPAPPRMEPVDMEQVIDLSLGMLGQQLQGIQVERTPPSRPMRVLGDANLLQQVVINLILNAKAGMSASQERKLTIHFCPHSGEDAIRLRFDDTGKGIPKALLRDVFEPFFTQGKKEGFGLGLFIASRVIERHGGLIFAESEEGKGAAIIIELPALGEGAAPPASPGGMEPLEPPALAARA